MIPIELSNKLKEYIFDQKLKFKNTLLNDWNHKPSLEKWSKKEILGHLVDSAFNNIHRFIRTQYDDQSNISYDQNKWVKIGDYQNQDIESIIDLWSSINLQIATIWKNTSADQMTKTIPVMNSNPTLKFLMEDYMSHMEHHIKQLTN